MNKLTSSQVELTLARAGDSKALQVRNSVRITYEQAVAKESLRQEYIDQTLWKETLPFIDTIDYVATDDSKLLNNLIEIQTPTLVGKIFGKGISLNVNSSAFNHPYIKNEYDFMNNLFNRSGYNVYELTHKENLPSQDLIKKHNLKNDKTIESKLSEHRVESYALSTTIRLKNSTEYLRFITNNVESIKNDLVTLIGHDRAIALLLDNKPIITEKLYTKALNKN